MECIRTEAVTVLDSSLIVFIISPCCVLFWRGTWIFLDVHLFRDNTVMSYWTSFLGGLLYILCAHLLQDIVTSNLVKPRCPRAVFVFLSLLYYYIGGLAYVNVWRGFWGLLDFYTCISIPSAVIVLIVSVIFILAIRGVGNLIFPPGVLSVDWQEKSFYMYPTRFQTPVESETLREAVWHIGDVLVSYFVMVPAYIGIWRGIWECFDLLVYPGNTKMTGLVSIIYGFSSFLLLLFLKPYVHRLAQYLARFLLLRLWFVQLFDLIQLTSVINIWRGIWNLADWYIYPQTAWKRALIMHTVGYGGLVILGASRSLGEVTFNVDATEKFMPVQYLSKLPERCSGGEYQRVAIKEDDTEELASNNPKTMES